MNQIYRRSLSGMNVALRRAIRRALLTGTGAALCAPQAFAAADTGAALEEITVTATRRDSSIVDVPYSISAVSGTALQEAHIQSFSDLTKLLSGVSYVDQGPTSRSDFVIRGITSNPSDTPSSNTVAPVSTYVGETPLFLSLHLDDLQRVEVLRGPQGTLYGSGALAGTIRFIPNKPDPKAFAASVDGDIADVAHSNQTNHGFNGMINVPLSETLAVRLSGGYTHYAGFINENYIVKLGAPSTAKDSPIGIPVSADPNNPNFGPLAFTPVKDANTADLWETRASLLWKPDENFSALLTYYHQDDKSKGAQAHSPNFVGNIDTPPSGNPFYSSAYPTSYPTGGVVFPHNGNYDLNDSFLLNEHRQADLGSVDLSENLGFATLTSSTSYYRDRGESLSDNTGLLSLYPTYYGFIPRMVDYQTNHDETKGFVEEIRLLSATGKHFDYVAGLFFQHIQTDSGQFQWIPGTTYYGQLYDSINPGANQAGANYATLGDLNYVADTTTDFKDRAVFGELTYHATDQWQITGGARFFKQDFSISHYSEFPYCGGNCGTAPLGTDAGASGYSVSDHTLKLNTSYKVSQELNGYLNYAEGFRRGGSNGIPTSGYFAALPSLLIYTPDKTKDYEIGAKGRVGGINYSAALFYIDWENFQVETVAKASAIGIAVNGPKAKSKGLELSLDGELTSSLSFTFGYAYSHAQVAQDFSIKDITTGGASTVSIVTGRSGDDLPNSPKHSATLGLDYTHPAPAILDGWKVVWHVNGSYRSATTSKLASVDPTVPLPFVIKGFTLWDASVELANGKGLYTTLYGQNLFDQEASTGGSDAGTVGLRAERYFIGRPRTVGLRVGYKF